MKLIKTNNSAGQSLIEVVLALAVLGVVIVALVYTTTKSANNTISAKNQSLATKYAGEMMEQIKQKREVLKNEFFVSPAPACDLTPQTIGIFSLDPKCAAVTLGGEVGVGVTVEVSWEDSLGVHSSNLQTIFTKKQ